ncbi:hypothetical protein OQ279_14965 [Salinimicrobium sp. MT39]|uniref:DUF3221 domain-containing protein n=1 Tax=Salinimicrobium profundisediminis TaxID=2994553 RepID=A0A9X3I1U8_9FLAO|nr:hypothetical protein [Salinimicrobium profundisediminis]MCX2839450.1 hypothetical protein [Salinimicrobium profundisediminis]
MRTILLLIILLVFIACEKKQKRYEDYNEKDFYEVQGIITEIRPTSYAFDSPRNRNIFYDYHLEMNPPLKGSEEGIDLVLKPGDPIVVLVHKENIEITFYGRYGIIDQELKMK